MYRAREFLNSCDDNPCGPDEDITRRFDLFLLDANASEDSEFDGLSLVDSGNTIPSSYAFDVDFGLTCAVTQGIPAFCGNVVDFEAELLTIFGTHADGGGVRAYADNTTYLQINGEFTSASNYQYIGRQLIPLPGAAWLMLSAVVPVGLGHVRRSR